MLASSQVLSDFFLFLCTYIIGLTVRVSAEMAQRKAFSETKECIVARLNLQKQNLQQVSRCVVWVPSSGR